MCIMHKEQMKNYTYHTKKCVTDQIWLKIILFDFFWRVCYI